MVSRVRHLGFYYTAFRKITCAGLRSILEKNEK